MSSYNARIFWSELMSRDYEASKNFYAEVLGWAFEDMDGMGGSYTIAMHDGEPVAGFGDSVAMNLPEEVPSHWMTYIGVDDIDAVVEKVKANGGSVKNMPFDVPGVGKIAIVADPSGAVVGLTQPMN